MVSQRAKKDDQSGMFDVVLEDIEFEAAIREWIAAERMREQLSAIKRRLKEGAERNDIKSLADGARVRCGEFTFDVKARSGGGFEISEWETKSPANWRPVLAAVD